MRNQKKIIIIINCQYAICYRSACDGFAGVRMDRRTAAAAFQRRQSAQALVGHKRGPARLGHAPMGVHEHF